MKIVLPIKHKYWMSHKRTTIDKIKQCYNVVDRLHFIDSVVVVTDSEHVRDSLAKLNISHVIVSDNEYDLVNEIEYCWPISKQGSASNRYIMIDIASVPAITPSLVLPIETALRDMPAYSRYMSCVTLYEVVSKYTYDDVRILLNSGGKCLSLYRVSASDAHYKAIARQINIVGMHGAFLDFYIHKFGKIEYDTGVPLMRAIEHGGSVIVKQVNEKE